MGINILTLPCGQGHIKPGLSLSLFLITLLHLFIYLFIFLAALGHRCCVRAFSSCGEQGLLFVVVRGLLLLQSTGSRAPSLPQLWHVGSAVVAHRL